MATTMASNSTVNNGSSSGSMHHHHHHYSDHTSMNCSEATNGGELTKRFAQMQLKTAACHGAMTTSSSSSPSSNMGPPKRQPTIVCEDIADDDELIDDEDEGISLKEDGCGKAASADDSLLMRSASSASLTVPVLPENEMNEIAEKRRPPLPAN